MDTTSSSSKIGYDRRKFSFPYNATGIQFSDSRDDPRLQVVDIIASCVSAWAKGVADETKQDKFWLKINDSQVYNVVFQGIWPSDLVTPKELGCDSSSGTNSLDMMANYMKTKQI